MMPISENKKYTSKPKVKQKNPHFSEPCDPNSNLHSKSYIQAPNQTKSESFNHFSDCESQSSGLSQSEKHFTNDESFHFKDRQSVYQTRSESMNHFSDCKSLCTGPSQSEKDSAKNIHSNSSQALKQTKSESFNQSFDCCSVYSRHSQTEKDYSTTSQTTFPADYIPSVYALPISCSGNLSNIDSKVPSVIAPPKCNELTTLEENKETYDTKFKNSHNTSDCPAPCQTEKDFSIADSTFSQEEAVDYIPSVYALPISFSVANQPNNNCDFASNIPPPILNAPKANQNFFPQKVAMQENAIPSETNQSQIENSDEATNQVLFKEDDIPSRQETEPFAASKILCNNLLQNQYTRLYTTNIHNMENYNVPYVSNKNIDNNHETNLNVLKNKKHKKLAKQSPPIKTCDLFSDDYLNSLIELGSKSLKNSLDEPDCDSTTLKNEDTINSFIELGAKSLKNSLDEPDCDSMTLKNEDAIISFIELGSKSSNNLVGERYCDSAILKNKYAISELPIMSFQEQHLNLCDANRPKNDYVVECIKNEQKSSVYACQTNSEQSAVVQNVSDVFYDSGIGLAKLTNESDSTELKRSNMSVIYDVQSNDSYNLIDQAEKSLNSNENLQSMIVTSDLDPANQPPDDKIGTKISDYNKVFFKMPSKSIDSGLGSLSQENLTISLSDISEKLTDNSVIEHISNEDKFATFLRNCSLDDEDLNEMERIDSVVDKFFDYKIN